METDDILSVAGLSKGFPDVGIQVLEELSFGQRSGEFLAFAGPSGCGKTTLLRCLSGLIAPDSGRVWHRGEELSGPPSWLSIVFQDYTRSLFPWLSVRRNAALGLADLDRRKRDERVEYALGLVGLEDAGNLYPWQMSGGMQQRAALARSIAAGPSLLLLDEPFAAVDAQTRIDLQDMVMAIASELELSVLLVTHDIDEAVFMADRVMVLSARPAQVVDDIDIDLPRPRDQLATKESERFLALRHHVFTAVRREAKASGSSDVEAV